MALGKLAMNRNLLAAAVSLLSLVAATQLHASPIEINFADVLAADPQIAVDGAVPVGNYYLGGNNGYNEGPGPNYGISFSEGRDPNETFASLASYIGIPNIPGGPDAGVLGYTAYVSQYPTAPSINIHPGFSSGLNFYYFSPPSYACGSTPDCVQPASGDYLLTVNVWSGLDGTGTLIATKDLTWTPEGDPALCENSGIGCPFVWTSLGFAGVAKSVTLDGTFNVDATQSIYAAYYIGLADMTFGAVPEPSTWAFMGLGALGLGGALRAKRRTAFARCSGV